GRLATVYCPQEQVRTQLFMMIPPEAEDWARENEVPLPPVAYDSSYGPPVSGGPVSITRPTPYSYVSGDVAIEGSAYFPTSTRVNTTEVISGTETITRTETVQVSNFRLYRTAVGQGLDPASWTQIGFDHDQPRSGGTLDFWNTRAFADGLYTVQLTAVGWDSNSQRATVQVYVDNVAPAVTITYPYPEQMYELGGDSWLNIQADASDNITVERVEFFINGQLIESSRSTFNVRWMREDAGLANDEEREVELYAVAYDAAGNRTQSEPVRIRVRGRE
ncbi:MAG: Ig-like domain-containing protein, partial [Ardenticatenaceae bacterium]